MHCPPKFYMRLLNVFLVRKFPVLSKHFGVFKLELNDTPGKTLNREDQTHCPSIEMNIHALTLSLYSKQC